MKFASKRLTLEDDKRCEKILKSSDIMDAHDWLELYPKSLFSTHALTGSDPNGTPLAPVVARLSELGAQRVIIHHDTLGKMQFSLGVIVELSTDPAARRKLFVLDSELSQICLQKRAKDYGQKYQYYTS